MLTDLRGVGACRRAEQGVVFVRVQTRVHSEQVLRLPAADCLYLRCGRSCTTSILHSIGEDATIFQ